MGKETKSATFYLIMVIIFGSLMYLIVKQGEAQQASNALTTIANTPHTLSEGFSVFLDILLHQIESPVAILLLQLIVILLTCRLFGWLFMKIGQPTVIGEIVAGIFLGPSLLGYWFPSFSAFLFRPESLANINILSQFGLILFMFCIGMELDITEVRKKLKETILISHTSTIVPFFFGMLTAYFIYDTYTDKTTPFLSFALFVGIAMSITAFPVLARIIQEKGLSKSHLGTISIASAANGDITAWCLLAVVVAIAQAGSMLSAVYNILFAGLYLFVMFFAVRPFLRMMGDVYHNKEVVNKGLVAFLFLLLIASSYLTEILGLHALFGAFIAGVVMPGHATFRKIMTEKVEDVSLALFLPLFFASTGLRTEIGLLNTPDLWWMCGLITLVAIVGKFGGAFFSARFVGESLEDSLYIGALMNTRGLMELVILTIGYEMGILPPAIFVMLVLMTLVTTFMTTPLMSLIKYGFRKHENALRPQIISPHAGVFKVLLSFGRAGNGQVMLDVAHQLFSQRDDNLEITALHLTVGTEVNPLHTDTFEEVSFGPILYGAQKLGIPLTTRYEISANAEQEIIQITNEEEFDFLLVGAGLSLSNLPGDAGVHKWKAFFEHRYFKHLKAPESWFYPGTLLKDKTKLFIEQSRCAVGVFVNRNFTKATTILVLISSPDDLFLLPYAATLSKSAGGQIRLLNTDTVGSEGVATSLLAFKSSTPKTTLLPDTDITAETFDPYNFMLISYHTWNEVSESRKEALQQMPSTLIISK